MTNYFDSPFKGKLLSEQVKNPNIKVGRYSYYSGYYHGHSFDDCARYLFPDRDDVDKLIIGSFCSIGSGASFIMAGNQGHRYDWASSFPFFYMQEEPAFSSALDAFQKQVILSLAMTFGSALRQWSCPESRSGTVR
ncbi:hypothetical protein IOMTU157_1620 [Citrobacter portucalensis]|nr:hypothetical protein IOMTU157_1620 [Citrobacter portucalensis]CAC9194261.1 Chloramphenicol acetyltransferase [Citrobacter youngae]